MRLKNEYVRDGCLIGDEYLEWIMGKTMVVFAWTIEHDWFFLLTLCYIIKSSAMRERLYSEMYRCKYVYNQRIVLGIGSPGLAGKSIGNSSRTLNVTR